MTAERLGTVVGLFVQRQPLKRGKAPLREYSTADIVGVPMVTVDRDGVTGHPLDAGPILDVHNRTHPASRDRKGTSGLSVMATGDYERLRARYGAHLTDGSAGCTVLLDNADGLGGRDLGAGLRLDTAGGSVQLHDVQVAAPCVEFSRYCLRVAPSPVVGDDVVQALSDLDHGHRGFKGFVDEPLTLRLGDSVWLNTCHNV